MHCMVLRCDRTPSAVFNIMKGSPDALAIEVVVCAEHLARLDGGEPFRFDDDQSAIYLESDMSEAGARPVARLDQVVEDLGTVAQGTVALEGEYVDGTPVTITFTRRALSDLFELMTKWPDIRTPEL